MGVVLPMISGKGEEQQTTREVNLLELTAAQQDRLPKLYQPLPPTTLSNDLLANSLSFPETPTHVAASRRATGWALSETTQSWADLGTPSRSSSAGVPPPSTPELPSLNLPPLPPIPSYIDISSLPPITSSEQILSQLQIDRDRPRQMPLPPEYHSGTVGQLPLPPDLQVEPFRKNRSRTSQLPLATDLQAYRPSGEKSPFSQLHQVEPSVMSPQQIPDFSRTAEGSRSSVWSMPSPSGQEHAEDAAVQSGRSAFEGLPVASALRVVGPLPEKIPQQAIDKLRRLQAQNRASNLEGTVAAGIPTGTTVELMPLVEAQRAISSAPKPEAAGLTKIPQQAIDELQRLQAEKRPGTQAVAELGLSSIPTGTFTVPEKSAAAPVHMLSETAAPPDGATLGAPAIARPEVFIGPRTNQRFSRCGEEGRLCRSRQRGASRGKIPQQALDELRRMQALHRAELLASNDSSEEAATSQTVASPQGATAESQPETVAAKPIAPPWGQPLVSAPETTPTSEVAKIPERASRPETPTHVMRGSDMTGWVLPDAIATLRQLQQQFAYNPAGTTPAEALASIQAWLDASKKAASNPELLWEPKRITASYPDAACRYGLDKNATDATVGVLVDPEGKISSQPETIESTGYALLNDIAMDAASSYDFAASGEYKAYLLEIQFSHSDSCAGTAASGQ